MRVLGVAAVVLSLAVSAAEARSTDGTGIPIAATAGTQFSGPVATFLEPNAPPNGNFSAQISWGDQSSSAGSVSGTAPNYTVSGSHTYSQAGSFAVSITLVFTGGSDTASTTATVAPGSAPPPPPPSKPTAAMTASMTTVPAGQPVTIDASRSTGSGPLTFTFDLTGNGTSETSCGAAAKAFVSFGTPGSHVITGTVTDGRDASSSAKLTINVGAPTAPPAGSKPVLGARPTLTSCDDLLKPAPCIKSVTFGIAEARNDCFKENDLEIPVAKGHTHYTVTDPTFRGTGATRLNGLDLAAPGGVVITIDQGKRTMTSTGSVGVQLSAPLVGTITLRNEKLDWRLPKSGSSFHLTDIPIGSAASILGLSLQGDGSVDLTDGATQVTAWVGLPSPISLSASVTLLADNDRGLHIDKLHIDISDFWIGPLQVKEASLDYNAGFAHWLGDAKLFFPGTGSFHLQIDIKDGTLDGLVGDYDAPAPGLPIGAGVFFQHAGVSYYASPDRFFGTIDVSAGPKFFGKTVAAIKGEVNITLGSPWGFTLNGDLAIVGIPFASAFFHYSSTGIVEFGGHVNATLPLKIASVTGDISGFYQNPSKWNIEGEVHACIAKVACTGGGVGISSRGVAGCVYTVIADIGAAYRWTGAFKPYLTGCGVEWIRVSSARALASSGVATAAVTVPAGLPYTVFRVQGTSAGVPNVVAHGPGGRVVTGSATANVFDTSHDPNYEVLNIQEWNTSYLIIAHPEAGSWTVDAQPGSAPISFVDVARGLPEPSVHAKVTSTGRRRTLTWTLKPLPGQTVDFWEETSAGHAGQQLATTSAAHGSVTFTPADGPAGMRKITAVVNGDGAPRKKLAVTTYSAPAPVAPGVPRGVRAVRRGRTLVVSWNAVQSAQAYDVRVRTNDRRHLDYAVTKRGASVPQFLPRTSATVTVTAVTRNGRRGRPALIVVNRVRKR